VTTANAGGITRAAGQSEGLTTASGRMMFSNAKNAKDREI
jgi:hypothetical protein